MPISQRRLYIVDTKTGEKVVLASLWSGGWYISNHNAYEMREWLSKHDIHAALGLGSTDLVLKTEDEKS